MKEYNCTASNRKHLDSLTRDYRNEGFMIITYTPTFRELEKDDELVIIEIAK